MFYTTFNALVVISIWGEQNENWTSEHLITKYTIWRGNDDDTMFKNYKQVHGCNLETLEAVGLEAIEMSRIKASATQGNSFHLQVKSHQEFRP